MGNCAVIRHLPAPLPFRVLVDERAVHRSSIVYLNGQISRSQVSAAAKGSSSHPHFELTSISRSPAAGSCRQAPGEDRSPLGSGDSNR